MTLSSLQALVQRKNHINCSLNVHWLASEDERSVGVAPGMERIGKLIRGHLARRKRRRAVLQRRLRVSLVPDALLGVSRSLGPG